MTPPKLPPLPPDVAQRPDILAWRIDWLQAQVDDLASRPSKSDTALPVVSPQPSSLEALPKLMWGKIAAAGCLVALGATGHAPWAFDLARRMLGG